MSGTARAHYLLAHIVLAGVVIQFLLAGLGVFGAASFESHAIVGDLLLGLALVALILAGISRRALAWTAGLLVAVLVQRYLPDFRDSAPAVAALHPLNAVLVLFLAVTVFRGAVPPLRAVERGGEATGADAPTRGPAR